MRIRLAIRALVVLLVVPGVCSGAVRVWDGGGADTDWTTRENWVGDVAPIPNQDSLEFPEGAARKSTTNNFPTGSRFLGIHFSGSTGGYVLSGQSLLLGGPVRSANTSGFNTINFSISTATGASMAAVSAGGTLLVNQISLLADLALDGAGDIFIAGSLSSTGSVTKTGTGLATLNNSNTYTGHTTVFDGTLVVNGVQSGSAITMTNGILCGVGTLGVVGAYAGTVTPGGSPGILRTGSIGMSQGTAFKVELNGMDAGFSYDLLVVTGTVNLNGASLNATLGFVPANFARFTIIDNDGTDPIAGTFAGLPEGSSLTISGRAFTISYAGGTGNDVVLTAGPIAYISGTITNAVTGAPVAAEISIYKSLTGLFESSTLSNAQGVYLSSALPSGSYFVRARALAGSGLVSQLYSNIPCPNDTCAVTSGTPVTVTSPAPTPNINFSLAPGGAIAGRVTSAATGAPVPTVPVSIYSSAGIFMGGASTNAEGYYVTTIALPTGSYFVKASPLSATGLFGQLYDNQPCPFVGCTVTTGTPVAVTAQNTTPNINFALQTGGSITGTVTNAGTATPVASARMRLYASNGALVSTVLTNAQGVYTFPALPTGSYFLKALPQIDSGLARQLYNGLACPIDDCALTGGTPIAVTAPTATTVNVGLTPGATITGTVTNATTLAPVPNVVIGFFTPTGLLASAVFTNAEGRYTSPSLTNGTYFVRATPSQISGLISQMYANKACPGNSCSVLRGTPVAAAEPNATSNIDFALAQAPPAPNDTFATALVIDSSRYQSIVHTTAATTTAEDPAVPCGNGSTHNSVWYVLTPTASGPVTVNTFGSNYNTILTIYTGGPGNFTPVGCNDDTISVESGIGSEVKIQGVVGQRLTILVTAFSSLSGGVLFVNATTSVPAPGPFGKTLPRNGARVRPTDVTLTWEPSANAQAYEYCIDAIHNNVCDAYWASLGTATSVRLTGLAHDVTYYWQVRAVNAVGTTYAQGSESAFWSLTGRLPAIHLNADSFADAFTFDSVAGRWQPRFTRSDGSFDGAASAGDVPRWEIVPATFDDGPVTDFFLFNPTTGQWQKTSWVGPGLGPRGTGTWWPGWKRHIVDLNGDGISDVFLYDPDTGVWFKALSLPTGFTYEGGAWNPGWEIRPMRLNDDAFGDMFLINRTTGQWFWALGQSGAGFSYPVTGAWLPTWDLYPGDFNGDGLSDLFLYPPGGGQYYVAINTGEGYASAAGDDWVAGWTPYVSDFNADLKDDLFLHNPATGVWFEMLSDGAGKFTNAGGQQWVTGWNIYLTDFNGDGRADILLYNPVTGVWYQARNLVNGTFTYTSGTWAPGLTVLTRWPIH